MADTGRGVVACYRPHRNLTIGRDPLAKLKGSAREWHPSSDRNCGARTFSTARTFFDERLRHPELCFLSIWALRGRYEWRTV
jgi:hypothetical protein